MKKSNSALLYELDSSYVGALANKKRDGLHATNYGIDDLNYEDETDDEEEPRKPIPEWARDEHVKATAMRQARRLVHFTRLFKQCAQDEIVLENIFQIKKRTFQQRSSSADWSSPPVWRTNGLGLGDHSFRRAHN